MEAGNIEKYRAIDTDMKISACIVIYNEKFEVLKRVIESFLELKYEKELIIVDNSQTDRMRFFLKKYSLRYIHTADNIGFASAHNLGYSHISINADLHLVLNPDIYFYKNEMEGLLDWMVQNKEIVLCTPDVLNPDGSQQYVVRKIPTICNIVLRKLKIDYGELHIKKNSIEEIPFAHGCCLIFQSDIYRRLNGFDERFFLYMEDADIFLRAKRYGKTVINTNYSIFHEWRRESSRKFKILFLHIYALLKFTIKYNICYDYTQL